MSQTYASGGLFRSPKVDPTGRTPLIWVKPPDMLEFDQEDVAPKNPRLVVAGVGVGTWGSLGGINQVMIQLIMMREMCKDSG